MTCYECRCLQSEDNVLHCQTKIISHGNYPELGDAEVCNKFLESSKFEAVVDEQSPF